jgi:hypothetical protein
MVNTADHLSENAAQIFTAYDAIGLVRRIDPDEEKADIRRNIRLLLYLTDVRMVSFEQTRLIRT